MGVLGHELSVAWFGAGRATVWSRAWVCPHPKSLPHKEGGTFFCGSALPVVLLPDCRREKNFFGNLAIWQSVVAFAEASYWGNSHEKAKHFSSRNNENRRWWIELLMCNVRAG